MDAQVPTNEETKQIDVNQEAKERSLLVSEDQKVLILGNGDSLEFKPELDTKTYMKMKQDTQRMVVDAKKQEGMVPLTKEYEYFADLCIKITARDGQIKPVNQAYLETLRVPDLMKIELMIKDLMTFDLGK
jgi:hypothetical protein